MEADRAARVARAWTMHRNRASLREIAAELECSPTTAGAFVTEARIAEEWRETQERAGRVGRMSAFLNELARIGVERLEAKDEDGEPVHKYKDVVPALMTVVQEINRVEGNYAPTRVQVGDDRKPPDRELALALEREARAAEAADAEESRRELE